MAQGDYGTSDSPLQEIHGEQVVYEPLTSDPPSSEREEGSKWFRSDLDSGDKSGTLRLQNDDAGNDIDNIPVFAEGGSVNGVVKARPIQTPNGEGFVPYQQEGGVFDQLRFQHNGTWYGAHDSVEINATLESYFEQNHVERPWQVHGSPNAVYDSSRDETYVVWHAKTEVWVTRYDHGAGSWHESVLIGEGGVDDYHGAPSAQFDQDGYLHVWWGQWGGSGTSLYARTDSPYDITSWSVESGWESVSDRTYPLAWNSSSAIYVGFRVGSGGSDRPFAYWKSTDNGSTWSGGTTLIRFSSDAYWIYCTDFAINGSDVHLFWRENNDSNGESHKVYHAIFDTSDDSLRAIDGTSLSIPLGRTEAVNNCQVVDESSVTDVDHFANIKCGLDGDDNPHAVIHGEDVSADDWRTLATRWDGSSWDSVVEVADTAGFHSFPTINVHSSTDVDVYTVVDDADATGTQVNKYNYNGTSWSLDTVVLDTEYEYFGASTSAKPYHLELSALLSQYDGSSAPSNDRTTRLKAFGYGDGGIVNRLWPRAQSLLTNHWRYSDGSGTAVTDHVGSTDASFTGLNWISGDGLDGQVGELDGSSDEGTASSVSAAGSNTFSAWSWFYVDDGSTAQTVYEERESTTNWVVDIGVGSSGELRLWINDGDAGSNVSLTTAVSNQTWYFTALVADNGNQATGYIGAASDQDLTTIGSQNYDQGTNDGSGDHNFGWSSASGRNFGGELDDQAYAGGEALGQSFLEDWFDATKQQYQ